MKAQAAFIICFLLGCCHALAGAEPPLQKAETQRNYDNLRTKIASGQASLAEVRNALTNQDAGGLVNTLHALYSMRWHRGVNHLLNDLWQLHAAKYPELAWELIRKPPARIALASTIARIQMADTGEYLDYMRAHQHHEHEFIRAQVVIGLGLNGHKEDVPYIEAMADGDNHYVVQSAVTALGLMNRNPAKDALIELWFKHRGTPRQKLVEEVLDRAYGLVPKERPKADSKDNSEQK